MAEVARPERAAVPPMSRRLGQQLGTVSEPSQPFPHEQRDWVAPQPGHRLADGPSPTSRELGSLPGNQSDGHAGHAPCRGDGVGTVCWRKLRPGCASGCRRRRLPVTEGQALVVGCLRKHKSRRFSVGARHAPIKTPQRSVRRRPRVEARRSPAPFFSRLSERIPVGGSARSADTLPWSGGRAPSPLSRSLVV